MHPDSPVFVERSLRQSRWLMRESDLATVERIARTQNLPEIAARLLAGRGVAAESLDSFLRPTLRNDLPDPAILAGMTACAGFLADAIIARKNIALFGDFDVDGAASSALMHRFLGHFGINAPMYIPDRLTEGYGPNSEALKQLKANGAEIVILLDCGTTAHEIVAAGNAMGLSIVILDHHEAEATLPAAAHLINPKRKDDKSGLVMLCAAGVTFMTCVAINKALRDKGHAADAPLKDWLDLVALATVCDMVPLTGVNRLLVRAGFDVMSKHKNRGLHAILGTAKVNGAPSVYHAGFVIGPRINAGGRIHKADLGAKLLATNSETEAGEIAWLLHDCNEQRKAMQATMEREAIDKVESQGLDRLPAIVVADESWHPGLAGLVAGKLKDHYGKPACVVTYAENGGGMTEARGSGRSVPGIHIAQAFIDARAAGLLDKGGGHAMAGGFSFAPEKLAEFAAYVCAHIEKQGSAALALDTIAEGMITARGVNVNFVRMMQDHIGPFGQDFPEPLFVLPHARIHSADIVGHNHLRLLVSDPDGGPRLKAVAFKAVGTPLGDAILKQGRQPFHLLGHLKINEWQGRENVELHLRDAAFAVAEQEARSA